LHIQTHILSGWCVGNLIPGFTPRERLLCMLAASLADLDGLSILGGQEAYWDYHHILAHNLPFGLLLCLVLAAVSTHRVVGFAVFLGLFHLHLVLDYYGSGPGWGIPYFWPFSSHQWLRADAWPFYSWQNISAAVLLIGWTVWIARRQGRTPLEALMPRLDRQLVHIIRGRRDYRERSITAPAESSAR
jgi:LexA-binding, inner membrane-associated putative hydrolase